MSVNHFFQQSVFQFGVINSTTFSVELFSGVEAKIIIVWTLILMITSCILELGERGRVKRKSI